MYMKYTSKQIVFQELPNEVALAYSISGCPNNCAGCHSSWLAQDIGEKLTKEVLIEDLKKHKNITSVLFLGGDWNKEALIEFTSIIKNSGIKVGVYSGSDMDELNSKYENILNLELDYLKVGAYVEALGGLSSPTTNQRLYKIVNKQLIRINLKGERI